MSSRSLSQPPSQLVVSLGPQNQNLVPIAQDIAIARGTLVTEVFFHIAAIRSLQTGPGPYGAGASVGCVAAKVQETTAGSGQQAAHLLPGQIVVAGLPVWKLACVRSATGPTHSQELQRLEQQTKMCFARTNVLPAIFNRADSDAEGTGGEAPSDALKPLFGDVVQRTWRAARVDPARPLAIDRQAVLTGLQQWFATVTSVYRAAGARKKQRGRLDEAKVLETYAESFQVVNVARFAAAHAPQVAERYEFL